MSDYFSMFADYNRWANRRVYEAAAALSESEFRQDTGAFFGSVQRTLNHILVADRIWMKRFTGTGEAPASLDAILFEDITALTHAREAEDERIISWIGGLSESALRASFTYSTISNPTVFTQPVHTTLAHVFNHQTHHRGQVHGILTALGKPSLALDLIYFQRSDGRKWIDNLS